MNIVTVQKQQEGGGAEGWLEKPLWGKEGEEEGEVMIQSGTSLSLGR